MTDYKIKNFTLRYYNQVRNLWENTENIELHRTDEIDLLRYFLRRNPGLSQVVIQGKKVIGTVLCSHDGRRGYLHHLAIDRDHRNKGIGSKLVNICLKKLKNKHIEKCNIFILDQNQRGMKFWEKNGFKLLSHFGWMQNQL